MVVRPICVICVICGSKIGEPHGWHLHASIRWTDTYFTAKAFTFLRGLARHNDKAWFEEHRPQYEQELRAPMLALVDEMDARFAEFVPEIVGERRRSMFRIHRDIRFSNDKRPYKTNAACWFFHRDAQRARQERAGEAASAVHGGAGLYFQLAPNDCWVGGGLWMPPRPALTKIREALVQDLDGFLAIVDAPAFRKRFGAIDNEAMLKRPPRGFVADEPLATWLRHQSFTAGRRLADEETLGAGLADRLEQDFRALVPLLRWLNDALGLPAAARR